MKSPIHFLTQTIFFTFIQILPALAGFILLKIFASYLTHEEFSQLSLLNSYSALLFCIVSISGDSIITRYYYDYYKDEKQLKIFYGTILLAFCIISIICFFLLIPFSYISSSVLLSKKFLSLIVFGALNLSIIKYIQSIYRVERANKKLMYFTLSVFFGQIIGSYLGIISFHDKIAGTLAGRYVVIFIATGFFLWHMRNKMSFSFNISFLKSNLIFFIPIVLYNLLYWFSTQFDQTIFHLLSSNKVLLANYQMAFNLTVIIEFILNAVNAHIVPEFNEMMTSQPKGYLDKIKSNAHLFILITLTGIMFTIFFVKLVLDFYIGISYSESSIFIGVLSAAYILRLIYSIYSIPIYYFKKTIYLPLIFAISAIINISLNFYLIPKVGIWGVIISSLISKIFQTIVTFVISNKIFYIPYNLFKIVVIPIILLVSLLISTWIQYVYQINFYFLWSIPSLLFIILIYVGYKKQIIELIEMIYSKYPNLKFGNRNY